MAKIQISRSRSRLRFRIHLNGEETRFKDGFLGCLEVRLNAKSERWLEKKD
jgi:hypothetical protein